MPFIDIDSIFREISSQMANSQLVQPQSIHSNAITTSSFRRHAARISKTNSPGNSPHGLERRKSTASHVVARHNPSSDDRCARTLSSGRATIKRSKRPMTVERPTTWHSSITSEPPGYSSTTFRNFADQSMFENKMSGYHPSEINGSSALTTRSNLPLISYGDLDASFEVNVQSRISFGEQQSSFLDASGGSYQSEPNDLIDYSNYPHMAPFQAALAYRHPQYAAQDWTHAFSTELPWTTACPIPHYPPTQASPTHGRTSSDTLQPRPLKEQNKELVGMGLYDSPDKDPISSLTLWDASRSTQLCGTPHHRQESVGKGLKLEETWQPPIGQEDEDQDEVEDEVDEDYSTDEGEEELPLGTRLIAPGQQQAALPAYGDLSNRTFFFDNDETFTNDLAFDQTFSFAQHKALDAAIGHATWI